MIDNVWKDNSKPYIIAEVSQNHDGSLGQAHAFIDAVAAAGADAVKFQTHIADEESTVYEPFRVRFSYEDATRYDYWKRMEFTENQWKGLYDHANAKGLDFLSSPFSYKALCMLDEIGVPAWKFGAGEVFNDVLLDAAIRTNKPILLSTGLSTYMDIDSQVSRIRENGNKFLLLQCVTAYPSTADMIDIRLVKDFMKRYGCKAGISDHSATIYPALSAVALGASAVEVHVTMSRYMFGPDVKASVDMGQLTQIVEGSKFISDMLQVSADMDNISDEQKKLKEMFSKSLYAVRDIKAQTIIKKEMFVSRKPNLGVDVSEIDKLCGRKLKRDLKKNEPLVMEIIE